MPPLEKRGKRPWSAIGTVRLRRSSVAVYSYLRIIRNEEKMSRQSLEAEAKYERLQATARGAGVKMTPQRLEIFRELAASEEHPDAESIHEAVRARMPTISLDTVYRTLRRLHDLGLIGMLGARRDGIRFDANMTRHHHYVCEGCGLVRDFESPELNALPIPASVEALGSVAEARVEVRGLCRKCQGTRGIQPTQGRPSGGIDNDFHDDRRTQ